MNETRPSPGEIVYLGCPYTDPDPEVRKHRFNCVTMAAAHLIGQGLIVYSPLTMTHPIDLVLATEGETLGSDYWVRFDEAFMAVCSRIVILKLDGWESSSGVRRETEWFASHGQHIEYLEWSEVDVSHGKPHD